MSFLALILLLTLAVTAAHQTGQQGECPDMSDEQALLSTKAVITMTRFLIMYVGDTTNRISEAGLKQWFNKFQHVNIAYNVTEAQVLSYFQQLDSNSDGYLTEAELVNGLCMLSEPELLVLLRFVERRIHPQCKSTGAGAALMEKQTSVAREQASEHSKDDSLQSLDASLTRKGCTPDVMCPILKTACSLAFPVAIATVAGCYAVDSAMTIECAAAAGGPEDPLSFGCLTVGLLVLYPCLGAVGAGAYFDATKCYTAVQSKYNCCSR